MPTMSNSTAAAGPYPRTIWDQRDQGSSRDARTDAAAQVDGEMGADGDRIKHCRGAQCHRDGCHQQQQVMAIGLL